MIVTLFYIKTSLVKKQKTCLKPINQLINMGMIDNQIRIKCQV